jgi:hypothetical protein
VVFSLDLFGRGGGETLKRFLRSVSVVTLGVLGSGIQSVDAQESVTPRRALAISQDLAQQGQYFTSARYAFLASQEGALESQANAQAALSLTRARLHQSASYFYVRTLQSGDRNAIRKVLPVTGELMSRVGADLIRPYLVKHTTGADFPPEAKNTYLYSMAKESLLGGDSSKVVGFVGSMSPRSDFYPYALQLRATAHALEGRRAESLQDFKSCTIEAGKLLSQISSSEDLDAREKNLATAEARDLGARCEAGVARVLYEQEKFLEAEVQYDRIDKRMMVWPDILVEQAWNAYAKNEYNRSLGKLVTYKSPALEFVYNPEIDILRAQSFLSLCLYEDAAQVLDEFGTKYEKLGKDIKSFVESRETDLSAFYDLGKAAFESSLSSAKPMEKVANRFVRSPYFRQLVEAEESILREAQAVSRFSGTPIRVPLKRGVKAAPPGFPGFLERVLTWRTWSVISLGGAFVKNSLIDHHAELISQFERASFIRLDLLGRTKARIQKQIGQVPLLADELGRVRGDQKPRRRDNQYYWSFNGEFWNDELGDYVFGLESECESEGSKADSKESA